jgi:UDP-2,3-diacylglucosamine pyrophosphatase LpxH
MGLLLFVEGDVRPVDADVLAPMLEGHPDSVIAEVAELAAGAPDEVLLEDELALRVPALLELAASNVWGDLVAQESPIASITAPTMGGEFPSYTMVEVPAAAQSEVPELISEDGVTRSYSSFLTSGSTGTALLERANLVLHDLAVNNYRTDLDGPDRGNRVASAVKQFTTLLSAARYFSVAELSPTKRHLRLAPGRLPDLIEQAVMDVARSVELHERLDVKKLSLIAEHAGIAAGSIPKTHINDLSGVYAGAAGRLAAELEGPLSGISTGVREGKGWWVEGERLRSATSLTEADLNKGGAALHMVVPELPISLQPPPPPVPPGLYPPQTISSPIILCLSDFHMGQLTRLDNADDVHPALDSAFLQVLSDWAGRVEMHRLNFGYYQPAYLVLHGDILDFWSADMRPVAGGGNRFEPDVKNDNGKPAMNPGAAAQRMGRIIAAHQAFFDAVTAWVSSNLLNFVIYVCGNHDDHLVRYGLGEALANTLHPDRGVFAAQDLFFPHLKTLIEHGHREDKFNVTGLSGPLASLGEMIVALLINPVERGGANFLLQLHAAYPGANIIQNSGIEQDQLDNLDQIYTHFRTSFEVSPRHYNAYLGSIDNLDNGGLEDAVADVGGRELVRANRIAADDADVADLDSDIEKLKSMWLSSDFQGLREHAGALLARFLSPNLQTHLVDTIFASDQAKKLGFDPQRGLNGGTGAKIHVVGHTHRPSQTTPTLGSGLVPAQHVNTGTGQDTWLARDRGWRDPFDLGRTVFAVENSGDSLRPVPRSQYCILTALGAPPARLVRVEGGPFRSLQAFDPINVPNVPIRGTLAAGAVNFVRV